MSRERVETIECNKRYVDKERKKEREGEREIINTFSSIYRDDRRLEQKKQEETGAIDFKICKICRRT